jgi:hypothetical protein
MKLWIPILILTVGPIACNQGVGSLVTSNTSATTTSTAIAPAGQEAAINQVENPSQMVISAKVAALAASPDAALLLAQFGEALEATAVLNRVSTDIDSDAISLADTDGSSTVDAAQAKKSELDAFVNYFFSNPDVRLSEKTCSNITDHMNTRITAANKWLAHIEARLACIQSASPTIRECWGLKSIATPGEREVSVPPYSLWLELDAVLGVLVTQMQAKNAMVKNLCTTYFQNNKGSSISKTDFEAAFALGAAAVASDTGAETATPTITSLVSESDLASATKALIKKVWELHGQLKGTMKSEARTCTSKAPKEEHMPFAQCWSPHR